MGLGGRGRDVLVGFAVISFELRRFFFVQI